MNDRTEKIEMSESIDRDLKQSTGGHEVEFSFNAVASLADYCTQPRNVIINSEQFARHMLRVSVVDGLEHPRRSEQLLLREVRALQLEPDRQPGL